MREESITVLHLRRERRRRKKELPLGFCPAAESVEVTLLLLGAVAGAGAACEDTAIRTASSSARREAARRSMVNAKKGERERERESVCSVVVVAEASHSLSFLSGPALGLLHQRAPQKESARERIITNLFLIAPAFPRPLLDSFLSYTSPEQRSRHRRAARTCAFLCCCWFYSPSPSPSRFPSRPHRLSPKNQKSKIKNRKKKPHSLTTCPRSPGRTRRTPRR